MNRIPLTVALQVGRCAVILVVWTFLCPVSAWAKNNCDTRASLRNPALLANSGIGGTGAAQPGIGGASLDNSGIGGTGSREGGIGGTGNTADSGIGGTGIIGIITGFASICVNDVEIHYDAHTPVTVDGRLSSVRDLAAGQLVAVRALGTAPALTARHIAVMHAVVGPLASLSPETGEIQVVGQTVHMGSFREQSNFSALKTGDWVQVSGHRLADGTIVASQIEITRAQAEARLNGHVTRIDPQYFEVNGTRVDAEAKVRPAGLVQGVEIQVAGRWDGVSLKARHIQTEPTLHSIGKVEHMVIEGYVHAFADGQLNLGNRIVTFDANTQAVAGIAREDFRSGQRMLISGRVGPDQRISAERIELKQETPAHVQDRNERIPLDGDKKEKKNNPDNEAEIKSIQEENEQKRGGGDGDNGNVRLKKEIDRQSDSSAPLKDERESGHSGSPREEMDQSFDIRLQDTAADKPADKPERPMESDSSGRSDDHRESLRDIDIPERARDHGGYQDRYFDR